MSSGPLIFRSPPFFILCSIKTCLKDLNHKYFQNSDWIYIDTTPFYTMARFTGAALGLAISGFLTMDVFKSPSLRTKVSSLQNVSVYFLVSLTFISRLSTYFIWPLSETPKHVISAYSHPEQTQTLSQKSDPKICTLSCCGMMSVFADCRRCCWSPPGPAESPPPQPHPPPASLHILHNGGRTQHSLCHPRCKVIPAPILSQLLWKSAG